MDKVKFLRTKSDFAKKLGFFLFKMVKKSKKEIIRLKVKNIVVNMSKFALFFI